MRRDEHGGRRAAGGEAAAADVPEPGPVAETAGAAQDRVDSSLGDPRFAAPASPAAAPRSPYPRNGSRSCPFRPETKSRVAVLATRPGAASGEGRASLG